MQISELRNLLMNHGAVQAELQAATAKAAGDANSTSAASTDTSSTITSNDFLKLLVAEMKNQDPTATTDPNAYIDQLVQVNSLQQLIQINGDLGGTAAPVGSSAAVSGALSKMSSVLADSTDDTAALKEKLAVEQH